MRFLLSVVCLFCIGGFADAGESRSVVVPTPAAAPQAVAVPTPVPQTITVPQVTLRQRVRWNEQRQIVQRQVTEYVPQTRTIEEEVVTQVPELYTEEVPAPVTTSAPVIQWYYHQQQCVAPTYAVPSYTTNYSADTCVDCTNEERSALLALWFAKRALHNMETSSTARPGEIRRARRAVAILALRLRDAKRVSGVSR